MGFEKGSWFSKEIGKKVHEFDKIMDLNFFPKNENTFEVEKYSQKITKVNEFGKGSQNLIKFSKLRYVTKKVTEFEKSSQKLRKICEIENFSGNFKKSTTWKCSEFWKKFIKI